MRRTALVLGAFVVALLALYWFGTTDVKAAKSQAQCWFAEGWLYAVGLPIGVAFSVTSEPYPIGVTQYTADGTFAAPTWATAAYFWTRGHGPSLMKAGPQLNDYSLKAVCFA